MGKEWIEKWFILFYSFFGSAGNVLCVWKLTIFKMFRSNWLPSRTHCQPIFQNVSPCGVRQNWIFGHPTEGRTKWVHKMPTEEHLLTANLILCKFCYFGWYASVDLSRTCKWNRKCSNALQRPSLGCCNQFAAAKQLKLRKSMVGAMALI